MLSERDKLAVFALLIRQVEAQEKRATAQQALDAAKLEIVDANSAMANIKIALSIFGFDMSADKPWDNVREGVGADLFNEAIDIAKGRNGPQHLPQASSSPPDDPDDEEDDYSSMAGEEPPTRIKDFVLEVLKDMFPRGAKVGEIKAAMDAKTAIPLEMHDKTVGMTLYRLSKEGRVHREKRLWSYIPTQEDEFKKLGIIPPHASINLFGEDAKPEIWGIGPDKN